MSTKKRKNNPSTWAGEIAIMPNSIKPKTKGRLCSVPNCTKQVQQSGVCCRHGAKTVRARCTALADDGSGDGCTNVAKRGGLCRRHGAFELETCQRGGCKRVAKVGVFCDLHTDKSAAGSAGGAVNEVSGSSSDDSKIKKKKPRASSSSSKRSDAKRGSAEKRKGGNKRVKICSPEESSDHGNGNDNGAGNQLDEQLANELGNCVTMPMMPPVDVDQWAHVTGHADTDFRNADAAVATTATANELLLGNYNYCVPASLPPPPSSTEVAATTATGRDNNIHNDNMGTGMGCTNSSSTNINNQALITRGVSDEHTEWSSSGINSTAHHHGGSGEQGVYEYDYTAVHCGPCNPQDGFASYDASTNALHQGGGPAMTMQQQQQQQQCNNQDAFADPALEGGAEHGQFNFLCDYYEDMYEQLS